jgi:hypothetical protein
VTRSLGLRFTPLLAALSIAGALLVARRSDAARPPKLDPKVLRAVDTGLLGASIGGPRRPGSAPVLVELDAPVTRAAIARLRGAGAVLGEVDGVVLSYDRFVPARVDAKAASALAAMPDVARIALLSGAGPLPLDHSAELIDLVDARGARPALDLMTGSGIVIGDVDSAVDLYHPTFFRGDAGYYDWIDVDGDGAFTIGVDAIDLNRNGAADPGEVAQVVRAQTTDFYGMIDPARAAGFDPGIDWIYLDTNGNGQRDYGEAAGFDDATPAFGEPLFVPDDVNRNGKLDVGERVVRLGTNKLRAYYVNLDYEKLKTKHVYQRGIDLSSSPVNYSNGTLYGFDDAFHATGVLTIVAGDWPLVGRRWVGLAPDADIVIAFDVEASNPLPVNGTTWALGQKPDVMLYELAPWTGTVLDGSDPMSALIDASATSITHTCPLGDEGSAGKHTQADLAAGAGTTLAFTVPAQDKEGDGPLTEVEVSLDITQGQASAVTFTSGAGDVIMPFTAPTGTLANGSLYYATSEDSPRGTQFLDVIFYAPQGTMMPNPPVGAWSVAVTAETALRVDAYVSDSVSGWGVGAEWDASIATDTSTLGIPSVADNCIAVGAFPNHVQKAGEPWYDMYYVPYNVPAGYAEAQGQVRAYSPQGPRIDGVQKPDVLAPDNPWVAGDHAPGKYEKPYGDFLVFGGTSGAAPHVTGTAALLAQAGIRSSAARDAIRAGAISDAVTGSVPNGVYGYGRLDAAAALGVKTAEVGGPSISLTLSPSEPTTAAPAQIDPVVQGVSGGTAGLQVKWDDGYDGTWDTAYAAPAPHAVSSPTPATLPFKARVRDAAGHIAEAVVWVKFVTPPPAPPPPPPSSKCSCRAAGESAGGPGAVGLVVCAALVFSRRGRKR